MTKDIDGGQRTVEDKRNVPSHPLLTLTLPLLLEETQHQRITNPITQHLDLPCEQTIIHRLRGRQQRGFRMFRLEPFEDIVGFPDGGSRGVVEEENGEFLQGIVLW